MVESNLLPGERSHSNYQTLTATEFSEPYPFSTSRRPTYRLRLVTGVGREKRVLKVRSELSFYVLTESRVGRGEAVHREPQTE